MLTLQITLGYTKNMSKINTLKKQVKKLFSQNRKISSLAFGSEILTFNAKGINHLFYKNPRNIRNIKEIETRINLIPSAIKLIKIMPVFQEQSSFKTLSGEEINYWSFEGVIDGKRIKVIIRQIGNGNKHFWSVIPNWRRDRFNNIVNSRGSLGKAD